MEVKDHASAVLCRDVNFFGTINVIKAVLPLVRSLPYNTSISFLLIM
jgi:hypothetical protein